MRAVTMTEPGKLELSFMWLPGFISYDIRLKKEIEEKLAKELKGKPADEETLDWAHHRVLDLICEKHSSIVGLYDYLDALKFVEGTR
jgi:hypothetical protein